MKPPERRRPSVCPQRPSQPPTDEANLNAALPSPQCAGHRTFARFLGTALRHTRAAVAAFAKHGISPQTHRELQAANDALQSALWLSNYLDGDNRARRD